MSAIVRSLLDKLYRAAATVAALCLVAILIVIVAQMVTRWLSIPFPGAAEYAGYLMASASFLAFASALNQGVHIRVGLWLNTLGARRRHAEIWCLAVGSVAASYVAWHAVKLVYFSRLLRDFSQGQDETPMWIPQLPFAVGAVILAVAFIDNLLSLVFAGRDNIRPDPDAVRQIES